MVCLFEIYSISTIEGYLMPNPFLYKKTVAFQTIQFSVSIYSITKTVPFQTIQFSTSTVFSSIWPIDRSLSGATTLGQSGPGSDGNEGYSIFPKAPALLEPHHQIV